MPIRLTYAPGVAAAALLAGAITAWCAVHTVLVVMEIQRVSQLQPIDFDPSNLGMPIETAIPLGVFSGGIALVAIVQFVRLVNCSKQ